ncbi:MAG: hypothetical protein QME60_03815 [Verrucomicrobiota bacterium]|nr:hypothetical protein [Verrucomicrobiota bacterium]
MSTSKRTIGAGQPVAIFEVGQDAFKIMLACGTRGQVVVDDLRLQKVEGGGAALAEAMAGAVKGMNLSRRHVIGCLPRQVVNIRTLELPSTNPNEIVDMVDFQAAKQTPYSREEILSDYRVIGSWREGYTRVMLVIVQLSALRQYFYLLDKLDVDVDWMAVSSEGILNWFRLAGAVKAADAGAAAILDVDSQCSDFMVVAGGDVVHSRCIRLGASRILASPEAAWNELAQELRLLLETCRTEQPDLNLARLILTGAGARMSGLNDHLQAALNLSVAVQDETSSVRKMPAAVRYGILRGLSLTSLIGLAGAPESLQINLMPNSVKLRRNLVDRVGELAGASMAAMALLAAGSLFVVAEYFFQRQHQADLKAQAERLEPQKRNAERMCAIRNIVREYRNPGSAMANLLAEIHPLIPADLYLETLEIDLGKGRAALSGSGGSMKDARSLMTGLGNSTLFADVKEDGPLRKDARSDRFKFKVGCALEKPK